MRKTYKYAPVRKGKKILTFALCICLVLSLIAVIFLKTFEIREFTVTGGSRYYEQEIKEFLITKPTDKISLFFWLHMRMFGYGEIPFVEKIETELTGRRSVEVTVHDKIVTGCVEQMGSYLYFDRDGMVVESSKIKLPDVPVVSGLKFSKIVLFEQMVTAKEGIFDVILDLTRLIQKQELIVSEIAFDKDYAVTLHIDGNQILLGKREQYDEVLSVLKSIVSTLGERKLRIDMTTYENGNNRITAQDLNGDSSSAPMPGMGFPGTNEPPPESGITGDGQE